MICNQGVTSSSLVAGTRKINQTSSLRNVFADAGNALPTVSGWCPGSACDLIIWGAIYKERSTETHCEKAIGSYVLAADLERFYAALAKERGWAPRSWHVIGREFGKLTTRVSKRRDGRRFNAYKIPRGSGQQFAVLMTFGFLP